NVAAAIVLAATDRRAEGRIYNIGEEEALTESEWVRSIGWAAGWDGEIVTTSKDLLPPEMVQNFNWEQDLAADTSRIRKELGYKDQISRMDALKETIAWERT